MKFLAFLLFFTCVGVPARSAGPRSVISLDGTWQIAEGGMESPPEFFRRSVPVPGLVSLASPPFDSPPGPAFASADTLYKDPARDAFWYRRNFIVGETAAVALLKVRKAMFGTKVMLNGIVLGEHLPNFTPGYFDAKAALRQGENELVIRVGADPVATTVAIPFGFDIEKSRYIPGIFDSVELILAGAPHIHEVQVAPEIETKTVRVAARIRDFGDANPGPVSFVVREWRSGKIVARKKVSPPRTTLKDEWSIDARIALGNPRLWSPEDPFLYTVDVDTGGDRVTTRFGMRSFRFDPETGRALLNGRPYFMRGSNITLYRFFEDEIAGALPWDKEWVRTLHQRVKGMHWNSLRYCIGFPPEFWYEIADEEGILLQDEYPLWYANGGLAEVTPEQLAKEYAEWMRERWNHPSVVIWDASNETTWDITTPAMNLVRGLDLSNRPWDNSYSAPVAPGDSYEAHPYHFYDPNFRLSYLAYASPLPGGNVLPNHGNNAVVINEYGWLWLNRDGSATTYTRELYANLLGPESTVEARRELYARYLAAETEFWRAYRKAAAVLHFTTLGYSRPDGQTSDHWADVAGLDWEPLFYRYVRDAFAPTGLMIAAWAEEYPAGVEHEFPIMVVNDRYEAWRGEIQLRLLRDGEPIDEKRVAWEIEALGANQRSIAMRLPREPGNYQLEAALIREGEAPVRSLRDFRVRD